MEKLVISETKDTPEVIFDPKSNLFSLSGVCHPENITKFYEPIFSWLENFKKEIKPDSNLEPIELSIFFKYVNSASYKYLLTFLQVVEGLVPLGLPVNVTWYYEPEDVDMREAGVELFDFSGIKLPYTCQVKS